MHSIKWVVHVCKNQGNKRERERELPEKWAGKLYFYASSKTKKQVTSAKSYPKWPVARVISHLINSNLSFMSYHWKTTSSPQCVQIIVSDAQWPFHIVQLSQTSDLRTTMLFTRMSIVESDVNIFWYSWGRYKDYTSDGHTAMSADWVIKATVPASTDLGPNCQTI